MYIRRKVFSLLQDESGEERYFSTTEFDYNAEEKTFSEAEEEEAPAEEEKKGWSRKKKVGVAAGATAATAATIAGAKFGGKAAVKALNGKTFKGAKTLTKIAKGAQVPADYIVKGAQATGRGAATAGRYVGGKTKSGYEKTVKAVKGVFKGKKAAEKAGK